MRRGILLAILAVCLVGAGVDVFWTLQRDLRRFDPVALGTLETTMWQSYYGRQRIALFSELAEMLRTQYQFPWLRSYLGAYHGAAAAFTFKEGKQRSDYQKALPALQAYFGLIRNTGNIGFDAQRAAALELEWWIVHRERDRYPSGALGQACAEAAANVTLSEGCGAAATPFVGDRLTPNVIPGSDRALTVRIAVLAALPAARDRAYTAAQAETGGRHVRTRQS